MANIQYITTEGERWDTISFKMYGTVEKVQQLIDANVNVPISERLPGGIVLSVPVLEDSNVAIDPDLLPPWKK